MNESTNKITLLETFAQSGQWERALTVTGEMLAEDPENLYAHRIRGLAALNLDRHKEARQSIERTISGDPDDPFPHYLLGLLHDKENRLLPARDHFLKALQLNPENADFWVQYGWNYAQRGDIEGAKEAADKALKLDPTHQEGKRLLAVANTHLENGDEQATRLDAFAQIEAYEDLLENDPEDALTLNAIGEIYLDQLKDSENGERHFRRALLLAPGHPKFRKNLFRALRRRDPVLRVLWAPFYFLKRCQNGIEKGIERKTPLLWMIPLGLLFLPIAAHIAAFWGVFLFIPAKVYEWLIGKELKEKAGEINFEKGRLATLRSFPFYLRFALFLILFLAFVSGFFWVLYVSDVKNHLGNLIGAAMIVVFM
ncbi:MAG: tetratricopeptide repeat protein, partial [Verrucomicrobiota bacterium]